MAALAALAYAIVLALRGHPFDGDQLAYALPHARILREAVAAGHFPLWSDAIWCGCPVHAQGGGAFLMPARASLLLPLDEVAAIEVEIAFALVFAALAAAWAARECGRSAPACATAGVVWALGGGLLVYQTQSEVLHACLLSPLVLALAARHVRTGALAPVLLAGGALGLMLLGGWPYSFMLLAPVLALGWLSGGLSSGEKAGLRGRTGGLALALALGLGLGAAQWVPTFELFRLSDRASGLEPKKALKDGSFEVRDFARLVSPEIQGYDRAERNHVFAYRGVPALALVALGARRGFKRSGPARFHAVVLGALLAVLAGLAMESWYAETYDVPARIGPALLAVPPFSFVRGPARLLIVVGLEASFLAAEGVDVVRRAKGSRAAWLAFAVVFLDLAQFGQRHAFPVDRELFRTIPEVARGLEGKRVHVLNTPVIPIFSIRDMPLVDYYRKNGSLEPNATVRFGVAITTGYGPLPIARSKALGVGLGSKLPSLEHVARAAASPIVFWPALGAGPKKIPVTALDRARIAALVTVARSQEEAFALSGTAPLEMAIVEGEPGERARAEVAAVASGEATIEPVSPLEVRVRTRVARGPALLVLADTFYPGWEATVRGESALVLRADFAYRGVVVPQGESEVVFRYRPASFRLGLGVSLASLLLLLGTLAASRGGREPTMPARP
ncbi:hypothetical protein HY251_19680 [bacterium]|nr:hypothetical protein [bacterium]